MATTGDVIKVAKSQLHYVEKGGPDGHSGNITRYWAELDVDLQGQPWCGVFVSWVFKHAHATLPKIDQPYGFTKCSDAVKWAKKHDLWKSGGKYSPGDVIFFDWNGNGEADHTGIVVSDDGKKIVTIEGNTSDDDRGSQRNGGGVYERERHHGPTVLGVMRMSTKLAHGAATSHSPSHPASHPSAARPTLRRGSNNRRAVRELQNLLNKHGINVSVDGIFGKATEAAVKHFQEKHKLHVDGVVGKYTWSALLKK